MTSQCRSLCSRERPGVGPDWPPAGSFTGRWNGSLALACDVPGFTNGQPGDLKDFRGASDLAAGDEPGLHAGLLCVRSAAANAQRICEEQFPNRQYQTLCASPQRLRERSGGLRGAGFELLLLDARFPALRRRRDDQDQRCRRDGSSGALVYGAKEIRLKIGMIEADLPDWLDVAILVSR